MCLRVFCLELRAADLSRGPGILEKVKMCVCVCVSA